MRDRFHADRVRVARCLLAAVLSVGAALRIVLYAVFHDGALQPESLAVVLATGFVFDFLAALVVLSPAFLALAGLRLRFLARPRVLAALLALAFSVLAFDAIAEYLFFEEFDARFNHIAVDYLLYPTEVFTNIGESYDVPLIAAVSLGAGAIGAFLASRKLRGLSFGPLPFVARALGVVVVLAAALLSGLLYARLPATLGASRITSEIAHNGWAQLARAFLTSDLDYRAYYATLPAAEARERAARVLGFEPPSRSVLDAPDGTFALGKRFGPESERRDGSTSAGSRRALDVVVVLEESLGSSFVGVLGGNGSTPEFDRWSKEGLLLTQLVATGNRTVRGLEGILCSFVPLPPDSVVKRTRQSDVACLAGVFAAKGYATCFLYGGYGVFDHMKPFLSRNGFAEFVEQDDYPGDAFRTAWGVADEYIFDALLEREMRAEREKTPVFATLLSVSNHRPYSVPAGRTERPAGEKSRAGAVRYADWCIGRYLDRAKERGLLDHTVVLVVGDHGARVYGSEQIPVGSYRIPGLFLAPDPALRGKRVDRLCSQIDLGPTLLAIAGASATAPFLGSDLLSADDGLGGSARSGRAFVQHDRDIGLLTEDALVVLGLKGTSQVWVRSAAAADAFVIVPENLRTRAQLELVRDAIGVFQTADELYRAGAYVLGRPSPAERAASSGPSR
jgi:phosphoglycerol transferase MdoB-like AlkP superfamily enzyme